MRKPLLICVLLMAGQLAQAADSVLIGLSLPRTGHYRAGAVDVAQGALLAVDDINAQGGVLSKRLVLDIRDSGSNVEQAQRNVTAFAAQGAAMVMGGGSTEETIAAGRQAASQRMLYLAAFNHANEITGRDGHRHLFREPANDWMTAQALGQYLAWNRPNQRYYYVVSNDGWGLGTEEGLRRTTGSQDKARHGFTRIAPDAAGQKSYQQVVDKIRKVRPDMLVLALQGHHLLQMMRTLESNGLLKELQVIIPHLSPAMIEEIGLHSMQGVMGVQSWTWRVPALEKSPRGERFVRDYVARYQVYPGSMAASAYATVVQWAEAAERTGKLSADAIIGALERHEYQLLKGVQHWRDFDHQNVQDVYVVQVRERSAILASPMRQDYFSILHRMDGAEAAQTFEDWQKERGEQLELQ
ncbi:MAG: ABC transporter substrate-binding protein [Gammaproteobacteria bacterium]|jgi:branched-chain amino acid transport system substrate-binding protein|nr:ABC transporter substrate-binding protein [Gammaproteobacteria bacterium]